MEARYVDMKSPLTGGKVKEVCDVEEHTFRGKMYRVHVRYYICEDTGEQFTCDGQDDLVLNQVYNQYRVENGFPFPEEIRALRSHYGLKQSQISKIVGFGINQWKNYEDGSMPSESNAKMILTLRKKDSMKALLECSRSTFPDKEFERLTEQIDAAGDFCKEMPGTALFYGQTRQGILNGFGEINPLRLSAMVRYLVSHCDGVCPTKLNKLMYYADFHSYRQHGRSISGLQYRAIQYGPVPEHYDTIYDNIEGIEKRIQILHDMECTTLHVTKQADSTSSVLSAIELQTLDTILLRYAPLSTSAIVELSHQEPAWQKHQADHSFMSFDEAFVIG